LYTSSLAGCLQNRWMKTPLHQYKAKSENHSLCTQFLTIRSWIWSQWILLLVVVDLIPKSTSLIPN
jgi:hypothetical protein